MNETSGKGIEVLCIGQAVIDCITRGQEPDRHRENVFRAERIELHIGGDAVNESIALTDLGHRAAIACAVRQCAARHDIVLVESAGGLDVPLTGSLLSADLAAGEHWPLILVTCGRLGPINHTLLSLEAAKMRRMKVAGVVHNWCDGADPAIDRDAARTTLRYLAKLGYPQIVLRVPRFDLDGPYPEVDFSELVS